MKDLPPRSHDLLFRLIEKVLPAPVAKPLTAVLAFGFVVLFLYVVNSVKLSKYF